MVLNKSSYLNIVLQDATGTIDAKLWSATDEQIRLFERGQVVRGKGDIINYKGMRQMKIVKLEPIEMNDEQKALFLPQPPIEKSSDAEGIRYVYEEDPQHSSLCDCSWTY